MAEDYAAWTTEELIDEIKREEELLRGFRDLLAEAETRRAETERAMAEERLLYRGERFQARARRIAEVERAVAEYDRQITVTEGEVRRRAEMVRSIEEAIGLHEKRLLLPLISAIERFITRETIARLRRSLAAYRGHLTRQTRILETLRSLREWSARRIRSLRTWQTIEEPYVTRLTELRLDLERWSSEIAKLRETIPREEARLQQKRRYLPPNKMVALHKRWQYKSARGKGHDISIEGVASVIIRGDEKKEDYEETLKSALEEQLRETAGFERLADLPQEILGFEEKPTDKPVRGVEIETLEWWHKVFKLRQLRLEDFLG